MLGCTALSEDQAHLPRKTWVKGEANTPGKTSQRQMATRTGNDVERYIEAAYALKGEANCQGIQWSHTFPQVRSVAGDLGICAVKGAATVSQLHKVTTAGIKEHQLGFELTKWPWKQCEGGRPRYVAMCGAAAMAPRSTSWHTRSVPSVNLCKQAIGINDPGDAYHKRRRKGGCRG